MDVKCRMILKNSFLFLFESIFWHVWCFDYVCVSVSQIKRGGFEKVNFGLLSINVLQIEEFDCCS